MQYNTVIITTITFKATTVSGVRRVGHLSIYGTPFNPPTVTLAQEYVLLLKTVIVLNILLSFQGIGMTKDELKSNLGTIARSGSKAFLQELNAEGGHNKTTSSAPATAAGTEADSDSDSEAGSSTSSSESDYVSESSKDGVPSALEGIIGQFGVGFYSAFMVGDMVTVHTRSARDGSRSVWKSDGSGEFTVAEAEPVGEGEEEMPRGCKIVIKLRDGCKEYAKKVRRLGGRGEGK